MNVIEIILLIVAALCFIGIIVCSIILKHNERIYAYRRQVLSDVHDACMDDIVNMREWYWRYKVFDTVAYNKMVWQFWKPIDSYYPNKSFTKIGSTK